MNKSYQELCDEVAMLRDQLADATGKAHRLELQLEASNAMLREALEIGEDLNARCRRLEAENANTRSTPA
ncbi:hypothetical protein [Salinicola tamaricis]|uniref:hypothetical protein n=1 Tax=Salinicola tamaricis TaxID=1771309 RepID=UPI000D09F212|nr:hypothetical protein [Salinicola tamaricis]